MDEVMTSAMKKCLNRTIPNGAITIVPKILRISILPFGWKTLKGLNMIPNRKMRVNTSTGTLDWFGICQ